ncbi:hypothetical protein [Clostridium butyricum]|uniref:hypothetical protein n=1 Tax=Clostridium butyricum TaxID=1492 RepID=UPI0022E926F7|nr:hypothetical protein [Clostridium butyricum]MDU3597527.1 hypothetical protein [Clostridium butyricum]
MSEKKNKLIQKKKKLESQIEQQLTHLKEEQAKLKIINQELENIEMREKANGVDQLINNLKQQGISNIETLIHLAEQGKLNVGGQAQNE